MTEEADDRTGRIIAALDTGSEKQALDWVERLSAAGIRRFKVGMELFYSSGPAIIERIGRRGGDVFVDLKLHDIPNTVAGAVGSLTRRGPWMINLHCAGGVPMMEAARRALHEAVTRAGASEAPLLIGVTVLTSLSDEEWERLGGSGAPGETARRWTSLAAGAGLDGVVCSPAELAAVRAAAGDDFLTVTPGIRPGWAQPHDQRRVATPAAALTRGADYLVIGRPLTRAADLTGAARRLLDGLSSDGEHRERKEHPHE